MMNFDDINFGPAGGPKPFDKPFGKPFDKHPEPFDHHHHHVIPPFDMDKRLYDFIIHVDRLAHKAYEVAGSASLEATTAKRLAEQALKIINKVAALADKANVKANKALADISVLKDDFVRLLNELKGVESELDDTQKGAGLAEDGKYIQNNEATYIKNATSLADADNKLDEAISTLSDALSGINTSLDKLNRIVPKIISNVGLTENAEYERTTDTDSLIYDAETVVEAINLLEGILRTVDSDVTSIKRKIPQIAENQTAIENLQGIVGDGIQNKTLTQAVNELSGLSATVSGHTTEITNIKNKIGDFSQFNENETLIGDIRNIQTNVSTSLQDIRNNVETLQDVVGTCAIVDAGTGLVPSTPTTLSCEFRELVGLVKCNTNDINGLDTRIGGLSDDISELDTKIGTITIRKNQPTDNTTTYQLYVNGSPKGETIVVDRNSVVDSGRYDPNSKSIILSLNTGEDISIPARDLIDEYTAGDGIIIDGHTISATEYVAGPGLGRTAGNDPNELAFYIKIENNSSDILHASREDGLGINVDRLRELIGGIDPSSLAGKGLVVNNNKLDVNVGDGLRIDPADNKVKVSLGRGLTINNNGEIEIDETYLSNLVNNLIDAKVLWKVKDNQPNAIEPKSGYTEVHVSGPIYSGTNN